MSLALDIVLIAVFAAIVFAAAKKGFVKSLLELAAFFLAMFLAFQFSSVIAEKAYDSFLRERLVTAIEEQAENGLDLTETQNKVSATIDAMPEFLAELAKNIGVDTEKLSAEISSEKFTGENLAAQLEEKIARPVLTSALTAICFIALAVILSVLLRWLAGVISKLFKLPVVGTANKLLGAALGIIKGVLVIVLFCTVLELLFAGGDGELAEAVNGSRVIALLDDINPIIKAVKEFI